MSIKKEKFPISIKERDFSEEILNQYNDRASDSRMKIDFENAANLIYGERFNPFQVLPDLSGRLYFFCVGCKKEMNNVKSLAEHAGSGTHLKKLAEGSISKDNDIKEEPIVEELEDFYEDPKCLQSILKSSKMDIVGLHKVEEYFGRGGKVYYTCTFCHAHGKTNDMVKHLIGDKHTDRYIRGVLELKNSTITADERTFLRKFIVKEEKTGLRDITIYQDPRMYPIVLENEGKPYMANKKMTHKFRSRSPSPEPLKGSQNDVHMKFAYDNHSQSSRSYSPPRNYITNTVAKHDVSTQTSSNADNFHHIKNSLHSFIMHQNIPETSLVNPEEVSMCLKMSFVCLHLLFFATKKIFEDRFDMTLHPNHEQNVDQLEVIARCMTFMVKNIEPLMNKVYPNLPEVKLEPTTN